MSIQTRYKARKPEMTSDSADSSRKLDDILAKMDVLTTAKNDMLTKTKEVGVSTKYNHQGCRRPEEYFSGDGYRNSGVQF